MDKLRTDKLIMSDNFGMMTAAAARQHGKSGWFFFKDMPLARTEYIQHYTKSRGFHQLPAVQFKAYLRWLADQPDVPAEYVEHVREQAGNVFSLAGRTPKTEDPADESIGVKIIRRNMMIAKRREKRIADQKSKDNNSVKRQYRLTPNS